MSQPITRYGIFVRRDSRKAFKALPSCDEVSSIISLQTGGGYATEDAAREVIAQFSADVRPMLEVSEFMWAGAFR
jgi:hypothetical protein